MRAEGGGLASPDGERARGGEGDGRPRALSPRASKLTLPRSLPAPLPRQVAARIAGSPAVAAVPWANFAGLTIDRHSAVQNALFSYAHTLKLSCHHGEVGFELFQKPSHEPPAHFLYSLPRESTRRAVDVEAPTRAPPSSWRRTRRVSRFSRAAPSPSRRAAMKNSINELWQAFGAYKWPEEPLPRRMSMALMVDAGFLALDDLETCIDHGALVMSADTRPYEDCPDCAFVPKGPEAHGCAQDECSIWRYSDGLGNALDPLSSVLVEHAENQCRLETFTNFTAQRLPQLYELIETAETREESDAAKLSYATIVNDMDYAACKGVFDSLYTTKSDTVFMENVRGCADPSNPADPCCSEAAQWGDCCLPEDKSIEIDGVFDATNPAAIADLCGARAADVTQLLDAEISQVLISASHPEFGCNAKYERVVPRNSDLYKTLWDDSAVSKCEEEVRWGKTVTGSEMCNTNDECWSGSCVSDWGSKRCTQLYGEAIAGPLLRCIVGRVDKKVWKHMAAVIDVDPSKLKKGVDFKGPAWSAAVQKFTRLVGAPNCVGEEAENGICAIIDITKEDCLSINHVWDWSRQMEWVVDDTNELGGFCKKRNAYWDGIHIHGHTENVQEECEAIILGMQGACTDSTMPNGVHHFKSESDCTGETETWHSFASHAVGGYRLASQKIHILEETSGNWVEAVRHGDRDKCTLQTTCNWDPDNRITAGDRDLCLEPSPLETTTYPQASFEEDGKRMACLQCWGSR